MSKGSSGGGAGGVATGFGGRTAVKKASGVRYVKSDRAIRSGDVAVKVSVEKLDKAWDKGQRIPPGGGDQGAAKYEAAKGHVNSGKKVRMPEITLRKNGTVVFSDGRHRAAGARDSGKKHIYVTVPRGQAKKVKRELGA
jgi:ketosteroid isomerase-like protein